MHGTEIQPGVDPGTRRDVAGGGGPSIECPECAVRLDETQHPRGQACACPGCGAWLYRGRWSGGAPRQRCEDCRAPLDESGACPLCGTEGGLARWFRGSLLGRLWERWRLGRQLVQIPLRRVQSEDFQPRLSVDLGEFENLRRSIDELGLIQPLLLRPLRGGERFAVISGHRRLLAVRQLGWDSVSARILDVSEEHALRIRLAENVHREPLADLELAESFERLFLVARSGSVEELAGLVGIDDERIRALLALLQAPPRLRESLIYGVTEAEAPGSPVGSGLEALRRLVEAAPARQGQEP